MKLIPTLHPAGVLRTADWPAISFVASDLRRALRESWTPELKRTPTDYVLHPQVVGEVTDLLRLGDPRPLVLDIETRDTSDDSPITMVGVSRGGTRVAVLPFEGSFKERLACVLRDPTCAKVAHNSPFDFPRLEAALDLRISGEWMDTAALWSLIEPDIKNAPGTRTRARKGGEAYCIPLSVLGSLAWDGGFLWKDEHQAGSLEEEHYCAIDVDVTGRALAWMEQRAREIGVWDLARASTFPAVRTCIRMGQHGVRVDHERMHNLRSRLEPHVLAADKLVNELAGALPSREQARSDLQRQADALEAQAAPLDVPGSKREAGKLRTQARKLREAAEALRGINLGSAKQLKAFLYGELGLPEQKSKKRGEESSVTTDDTALVELLRLCAGNVKYGRWRPIIEALREHRETSKVIASNLSYETVILSPRLLVWGTAIGRLSCVEPNLQNISKRKEFSKEVRRIYVPVHEGNVFTAADYSQTHLRIGAILSQETVLLDAFDHGVDAHLLTAALLRGKRVEDVTPHEREYAKRGRYGWLNGMGYIRLQADLAKDGFYVTPAECRTLLKGLDEATPRLAAYRDTIVQDAERDHVLRNRFGRIRWYYEPNPHGEAIAFPWSSSEADIMLRAMNRLADELPCGAELVLQVHDEVVVEHPPALAKQVRECLKDVMEAPLPEFGGWACPSEARSGPSLGELA